MGLKALEPSMPQIKGIAFDIDGTFYKEFGPRTAGLMAPILAHPRFFSAYVKMRNETRVPGVSEDYKPLLHQLLAERFKVSIAEAERLVETRIIASFDRTFRHIKPFEHVVECLRFLKEEGGYQMGALSDFPISHKLETLGLDTYIDIAFSAEDYKLKPHPDSFLEMARRMELEPHEILYVGNSIAKDVWGAHAVGMATALLWREKKPLIRLDASVPREAVDAARAPNAIPAETGVFSSYADLQDFFSK